MSETNNSAFEFVTVLKFCKKCQVDTERFSDGKCKVCKKIYTTSYRIANKEAVRVWNATYKANHKDAQKAYEVAYNAANQEKIRARKIAYRAANKDSIRAYNASYSADNRESLRTYRAAYRVDNKEAIRIHVQNRRARKRENGGILSKGLSAKLFKLQKGKCACCSLPLGINFHMDHIMPIALDGQNIDSNIQLLRQRCNNQKHAKHPVDFMQERGFLL